jgi:hypothetical protein
VVNTAPGMSCREKATAQVYGLAGATTNIRAIRGFQPEILFIRVLLNVITDGIAVADAFDVRVPSGGLQEAGQAVPAAALAEIGLNS